MLVPTQKFTFLVHTQIMSKATFKNKHIDHV